MVGLFKKKLIAGAVPPGMRPPSDLDAAVNRETATGTPIAAIRATVQCR